MSDRRAEDTDKQGGWLIRVKTPASLDRLYCVYEVDWAKAKELLKVKLSLDDGVVVEAIGPADIHTLTGLGLGAGDVHEFK